jgi:hypothetical protein
MAGTGFEVVSAIASIVQLTEFTLKVYQLANGTLSRIWKSKEVALRLACSTSLLH